MKNPTCHRAVLLVGFGGPEDPREIRPFLASVLRGRPVAPHRVEEVARQYERMGGRSPYNALAAELARKLSARLDCPVAVGLRHSSPSLSETLARLKANGVTDIVGVVLAAYRSIPSWHYYLRSTAEAFHGVGGRFRLRYVAPWHEEPLFEAAVAARVAQALEEIPPTERPAARWLFTAHSIPTPWDQSSGYSRQIQNLCARVAARLGQRDWALVYQSRSGRPEDPWLEPDISVALADGAPRRVLVIPVGFLMDHVEVLFDLDVKAREAAEKAGTAYHRAKTVGLQEEFLTMLESKVRAQFPSEKKQAAARAFRVAVVGGGISGLAAGHRVLELARASGVAVDLKILDAGARPGGVIETGHRDGFLWEGGPDSFITEKPAALALAARLGMGDQIRGTCRQFQQSFVVRRGRLWPTPEGFYLLAPTKMGPLFRTRILSWPGKLRAALELWVPPRKEGGDESLASFVRRRFGREVLDRLAQPMVAGIYSADPETLSLQATFPRFLEMEAKGGVIRGLWAARGRAKNLPAQGTSGPRYGLFATFQEGVGSFVQTLLGRMPSEVYVGRSRVTGMARVLGGGWRLTVERKAAVEADAVVLAVAAPVAAKLLEGTDGVLSSLLAQTPYGDVATVNVAVRRDRLRHPLDGFGFVVPSLENRAVTGCTFSSVKFVGRAPEGAALLRAFVGGAALALSDDELVESVCRDLQDFLGLSGKPQWVELRRYPSAMPQYLLGHAERTRQIFEREARIERLALAGNGYGGIGLPDCVASGEQAAERVARIFKL